MSEQRKCDRRGCSTTSGVELYGSEWYLCPFHREHVLGAHRVHERAQGQQSKADRKRLDAEAKKFARQTVGWVSPPPIKKMTVTQVCSGGIPSLGKGQ